MSLYKTFKVNEAKENKGVAFKYPHSEEGKESIFFVAHQSTNNKNYMKALNTLYKPYRRLQQLNRMDPTVTQELSKKAFIRGCLTGWENITNESGEELEFNEQNALKLFSDLPHLLSDLMEQATELSNYQDELTEESAKN